MPFESRSHYEFGDPAMAVPAADEARDHAKARARGLRVKGIVDVQVSALMGHAILSDPEAARVILFSVLVELLYGNSAVDVPELRGQGA